VRAGAAVVIRPTVAIITDVPEFSGAATRRWLGERNVPSFLLIESHAQSEFSNGNFDLAVVGGVSSEELENLLSNLKQTGKPLIHVSKLNGKHQHGVVTIPEAPGWPDLLVTVAEQIFQCERLKSELTKTQETVARLEQHAALGRYMLEARHNLNNALTSILGNSDLVLLDSASLPAAQRAQVETIRNMGMRLNEIMQRFSSIQKEMQLIQQQGKSKYKSATVGI
jgi:signal transduction histidine kinase